MGAVDILIVYEALDTLRITLKNQATGEEKIVHASPEEARKDSFLKNEEGEEVENIDQQPLTEWIVNNYKNFGANLEFITNK
ncbi:eukaryotic peptide chain release factor subunit, putative [Eimeria maxima]|uniref:Eukaryotic peptide chain release factor subunit, putative n=1 Tax=Eimeria maxima TaxID=5804 RepID=U6M489_EIMMA|nr:eukaryotic peptide chain release factor subunit, putative [Eimeria maxima]CDJ57888.1 eukaryotic peptide chain release factor subunit, putative [Eimeria maxima]